MHLGMHPIPRFVVEFHDNMSNSFYFHTLSEAHSFANSYPGRSYTLTDRDTGKSYGLTVPK